MTGAGLIEREKDGRMPDKDAMDALTNMLADSPAEAGVGIEHLCKQSAQKAINEVLAVLLQGAQERDGIIRLRFTEISEGVLTSTIRKAIDGCCG